MYDEELLEIVICNNCKRKEYLGSMVWYCGKKYCRICTYKRWQDNSAFGWKPSVKDYTFPRYDDGIDYTKSGVI